MLASFVITLEPFTLPCPFSTSNVPYYFDLLSSVLLGKHATLARTELVRHVML